MDPQRRPCLKQMIVRVSSPAAHGSRNISRYVVDCDPEKDLYGSSAFVWQLCLLSVAPYVSTAGFGGSPWTSLLGETKATHHLFLSSSPSNPLPYIFADLSACLPSCLPACLFVSMPRCLHLHSLITPTRLASLCPRPPPNSPPRKVRG